MDRLISEQQVLKVLDNLKANFTCYDSVTLDEVASHVKAIPSAEPKIVPIAEIKFDDDILHEIVEEAVKNIEIELKWISVSERLPEEGVDVLACFYTGEGNYKMMVSRRSDYNYWSGVGRTADMVAWMPLPEPYKGE